MYITFKVRPLHFFKLAQDGTQTRVATSNADYFMLTTFCVFTREYPVLHKDLVRGFR